MDGPIDTDKQVRQEPLGLPPGFEWSSCEIGEVQKLLAEYYVEDPDARFRLTYSEKSIEWATGGPGAVPDWSIGVRASESRKLLAFISGKRMKVRVNKNVIQMAEINFLCVHPKLRHKKLAPLMIREVTRRINLTGIWQAIYTGATMRRGAFTSCRYWHRDLNPKKLQETGFSQLKLGFKKPLETFKLRPMVPSDVPWVTKFLNNYLSKFKVVQVFDEAEVAHTFLSREDVVQSYVLGKSDFFSFYSIPSAVTGKDADVRTAYGYYFVPGDLKTSELLAEAMGRAAQQGYDVFNIIDVANNDTKTLWDLGFYPGSGSLHYYFFNWQVAQELKQDDVGIVLP